MRDSGQPAPVVRFVRLLASSERRRAALQKRAHRWRAWRSALLEIAALRVRKARDPKMRLVAIGLVEHMGDIVAAEPILRQVRQELPSAYIVWAVRQPFRELLELSPDLDDILVVTCLTEWIRLRRSRVFDEILDLHVQGRQCPICRVALHRPEGNQAITFDNYYHFGSLLDVMAQNADVVPGDRQPRLRTPERVGAEVDRMTLPARFIVIHCTANETARNWTPEGWRALVDALRTEVDVDIVEIGLAPVVAGSAPTFVIDLCGALTLTQMAEVIRRAVLFVGIDSGPAHVANAVSTPGVILLGAYRDFGRYMPYSGDYATGANATVVYEPAGLTELAPERVLAAVRERLALPLAAEPVPATVDVPRAPAQDQKLGTDA